MNKDKIIVAVTLSCMLLCGGIPASADTRNYDVDRDMVFFDDISDEELSVMAMTVYGECAGCDDETIKAVACVVRNRAAVMGMSISDICCQRGQFYRATDEKIKETKRYEQIREICQDVLLGEDVFKNGRVIAFKSDIGGIHSDEFLGLDYFMSIGAYSFYMAPDMDFQYDESVTRM